MNRLDFDMLYIDDLITDASRGHVDVLSADYSEGSTVIAVILKKTPFKFFALHDNGDITTVKTSHEKSGGTTWNGDDVIYQNTRTVYTCGATISNINLYCDAQSISKQIAKVILEI